MVRFAASLLLALWLLLASSSAADSITGSLEAGKLADLIVIDRNPLKIAEDDIANVKVLETVVGGQTVYEAAAPR